MATATATGPDTRDFLARVADPNPKLPAGEALTHYRALAFALADDPKYGGGDPEFVEHVLESLELSLDDLAKDVHVILGLRDRQAYLAEYDEAGAQSQLDSLKSERDRLATRLATVQDELSTLDGRLYRHRYEATRVENFPLNHPRLWGDEQRALKIMFPTN